MPDKSVSKVYFKAKFYRGGLVYCWLEYKSPYFIAGDDTNGNVLPWKIGSRKKGKIWLIAKGHAGNKIVEKTKLVGHLLCVKRAQLPNVMIYRKK